MRSDLRRPIDWVGVVTSRNTTFDLPPDGVGLSTVTNAVCGLAMSAARTLAVRLDRLKKVVARDTPFQRTTAPGTKPVPFTLSVNPAPPGRTASGSKG